MRRLPKYVHGYVDNRGTARHDLRRPGFPAVSLPGLPFSAEFLAAYAAAMHAGSAHNPVQDAGADRIIPRSLRALAVAYYDSAAFKALKPITQGVYRNVIDAFCKTLDANGTPYADKPAAGIKQKHVEALMDLRKAKPDAANGLRKVLREMMKVAVKQLEWRQDDPTQGVAKIKPKKKGGFHRWTDAEIAQFESRHPVGSKARLAMSLGLFTGQARQDVVAMGAQHISLEHDDEGREIEILNWVRLKTEHSTGLELAYSGTSDLARSNRRHPERAPDVPRHRVRQAVHGRRLRQLVP